MPAGADADHRYRLGKYDRWLSASGTPWFAPDLAGYRDYLLARGKADGGPMARSTVAAHLHTIRGRYSALMRDKRPFYELARLELERLGQVDDPANRRAIVQGLLDAITGAISSKAARVKRRAVQDRADSEFIRLSKDQAAVLLAAPGTDTLKGLRDTALLSVMLCTGIREAEARALNVDDLRQRLAGELALRVAHGKGDKMRLIPWGGLEWCLAVTDAWQAAAGVGEGPLFRTFYRGGSLRPGRISLRAVHMIVTAYPVMIDGERRTVRPHDLRRSYARRLYDLGVDVHAIQANLGHSSVKTTWGYIGSPSAEQRRPPLAWAPLQLGSSPHRTPSNL